MQNLARFRTTSKFGGDIRLRTSKSFEIGLNSKIFSEMDEDIQNWIVILCMAIPPALGKRSTVKFG